MKSTEQWRAEFDATVTFSNGGGLEAHGFRLDIPGEDIDDRILGELFVRHLGLLMVADVQIRNKVLVQEEHKGSRGVDSTQPGQANRRVIELSHRIHDGMVTYPGLPGPSIADHLTREASRAMYAPGTEFHIARISMIANTGTYLDAPYHRFADGADLAALPLAQTVDLDGIVVRVLGSRERAVDRTALAAYDVHGKAVLVHTGWDRYWESDAYGGEDHPFVTADAADWLVENGAALVGIDSLNIDDKADGRRPAHTALLRAGIPIVEHLGGLEELPPFGFRFHAAPLAVVGVGAFPVRAYAILAG